MTIASCMVVCGVLFIVSAWDEVNCVAGEVTSSGPCGIALTSGGSLVAIGIVLVIIGCIVLYRSIRRPVGEDGGDGWRVGQGIAVMICGGITALMIPLLRCPPGTTLSPVFRFCVNQQVSYPAPAPGLRWKVAAFVAGIAVGALLIRWRSMPIWLATAVVIAAFLGTTLFILWRTTGIPGFGAYAPGVVLVTPSMPGRRPTPTATPTRRPVRRW